MAFYDVVTHFVASPAIHTIILHTITFIFKLEVAKLLWCPTKSTYF